ncbi:hypothetical protein [Xenorhabdus sp. SGI240]|uniref:hypothetical protein n=1 Tax=Xenorhabdus sp. SGI240 TaxID=3158262 RepID=UPI0032B71CAF
MAHAGQLKCTGNDISVDYYKSNYNNDILAGKNMLSLTQFALASGIKVKACCGINGTVRDLFIGPNTWK